MPSRNWSATRAYIWELSEINNLASGTPFSYGGVSELTNIVDNSVEWRRILSAVGSGRATFYATTYWEQYLVAGRVCVVEKPVTNYGFAARTLAVFLIETVEPHVNSDGVNVVTISGPGVEHLLSKKLVWGPIGEETIIEKTLAEAIPVPTETTLDNEMDTGDDWTSIVSFTNVDKDDIVRIQMDNDEWHEARITDINPSGMAENTIIIDPPIAGHAAEGNAAHVLTAKIGLNDVEDLAVDQIIYIYRAGGLYTETRITDIRQPKKRIVIEDGLLYASDVGSAVVVFDYNAPTHSDVTQIVQYAPEWEVVFQTGNGTEVGTAHLADGESVLDLLSIIGDRTGEFWRYEITTAGLPTYKIAWRRTPDITDFTLVMYGSADYARQIADELDVDVGTIFNLRRQKTRQLITRVYPRPGSGELSLSECSSDALTVAALDGFTVHIGDPDDRRDKDYVEIDELVTEFGTFGVIESYGDIAIDDKINADGRMAAADQMLAAAKWTIQQANYRTFYTIECFTPRPLKPGQLVTIENETGTTPVVNFANSYVVLETTERIVDGRPRSTLVVSDLTGLRRTAPMAVAQTIRTLVQTTKRLNTAVGIAANNRSSSAPAGGGGGGGVTDHGALTGLTDDDHGQYLRTDGGRTLTGNLAVAPGVTIDGVDLSALPGGHSPVTPYNFGIRIENDQQVGLRLTSLPSGLGIRAAAGVEGLTVYLNQTASGLELGSDGMTVADALAGEGLKMASKVMHIDRSTNSGLIITADQLALGPPASLTAITTNAVTGASHSHAVSASANPGNTTQLLKTDANGLLQLFGLGIGTPPDGASGLKIMSPQPAWYGLFLKQRNDQTAQMLRIENAAGAALLLVTNGGDLESGNPGFTSGLRGWQIAANGDAEFNNVRIRGELHAATFVADEMHATGGTLAVATATTVARGPGTPSTLGAINSVGASTVYVTAAWGSGLSYFSVNDVIRIKPMGEVSGGGSLYLPDLYLEVNSVGSLLGRNLAQGKPGYYALSCTRRSGGYSGFVVPIGAAVVKWTRVVNSLPAPAEHSVYKGHMLITADMAQSPYLDVFTVDATRPGFSLPGAAWAGSGEVRTPPGIKPRVRVGNLDGVLGLTEQWGIAAGTDLSDTSAAAKYLVASNLGVTLRNIDLSMYSGADRVVHLSPTGLDFGTSLSAYVYEKAINWTRPSGTVATSIASMSDGDFYQMDLGVKPTFGADSLSENGIQIKYINSLGYGNYQHYMRLMSWGDIQLEAGRLVRLASNTEIDGDARISGGLAIGDQSQDPDVAVIRIKEKATGAAAPPATFGHIWLQKVGGVQKLYVRFENGVIRELATG